MLIVSKAPGLTGRATARVIAIFGILLLPVAAAKAQTATQLIEQDLKAAYQHVKAIMRAKTNRKIRIKESVVNLAFTGCASWSEAEGVLRGPIRMELAELAGHALFLADKLASVGYPPEVYRKELEAYENDSLAHLAAHGPDRERNNDLKLLKRLAVVLNQKRTSMKIRAARLEADNAGCGDPPPEYEIRTSPPGGVVRLIPQLYYAYCIKVRKNPRDFDDCNIWYGPYKDRQREKLRGQYKFIVQWPNGETPIKDIDLGRYEDRAVTSVIFK